MRKLFDVVPVRFVLIGSMLGTGVLMGCAEDAPDSTEASSEELVWQLESGEGAAGTVLATVRFSGANRITGSNGCSSFEGVYRRASDTLYVSALTLGKSACAAASPEQLAADEFVKRLQQAVGIRETATQLLIDTEVVAAPLQFTRQN